MIRPLDHLFFRGRSSWLLPLAMLIITILLFELFPCLDDRLQDMFYSAEHGWILKLDKHRGPGFFYYTLPNILIASTAAICLFQAIRIAITRHRFSWRHVYVILCIAVIPATVAAIKHCNNMPIPKKLLRYGGREVKRTLIEAFEDKPLPSGKHYRGWPAGHASGSCSLIGLAFVPEDRKKRYMGFSVALFMGFATGLCHSMDGNHFISHTFVTFFLAWTIAALLYQLFSRCSAKDRYPLA